MMTSQQQQLFNPVSNSIMGKEYGVTEHTAGS